jgi:hypothetical protein
MSSTRQPGQAASSTYNIELFNDALADYERRTGIGLSTHPFADKLEQLETLEDIHQLLREQEEGFKKYRNRNQRLIKSVTPWVEVLRTISGTLSEVLSLPAVSYACHLVNILT